MKFYLIILLLLFGLNARAGWKESVYCNVERESLKTGDFNILENKQDLLMLGSFDKAEGEVSVLSPLAPDYEIVYKKTSQGKNAKLFLTTKWGLKLLAATSVDVSTSRSVEVSFVSHNLVYEYRIYCSSVFKH